MHQHSLRAYMELADLLKGRQHEIAVQLAVVRTPMTDREIKQLMRLDDMNQVRPRITELIKAGLVYEHSSKRDAVTGRTVRRVAARITKVEEPPF